MTVTTCGYNSYPIDPLDFGGLISADVTKAKFKLEDVILDNVCSESPVVRNQCRDVNVKAFELALSIASEEARNRFLTQGRQLLFGDDSVSPWGPGWEYVFGLTYKTVSILSLCRKKYTPVIGQVYGPRTIVLSVLLQDFF